MDKPDGRVDTALRQMQGSIWQHRSGEVPLLLCMATRLDDRYVVTVADQGVDGFESKPPAWNALDAWKPPHQRFADLRLHSHYPGHPDDRVEWLYWAALCPVQPLVFLSTSEDRYAGDAPSLPAPMSTMLERRNPTLWRIGYGRGVLCGTRSMLLREFKDDPYQLHVRSGWLISDVAMTYFRGGSDRLADTRTLAAHAVFDYPGPVDYGAPVVTDQGLLAGVLVGGDLGSGASHQGAYVPIDLVTPFLHLEVAKRHDGSSMLHFQVVHHELPEDVPNVIAVHSRDT